MYITEVILLKSNKQKRRNMNKIYSLVIQIFFQLTNIYTSFVYFLILGNLCYASKFYSNFFQHSRPHFLKPQAPVKLIQNLVSIIDV